MRQTAVPKVPCVLILHKAKLLHTPVWWGQGDWRGVLASSLACNICSGFLQHILFCFRQAEHVLRCLKYPPIDLALTPLQAAGLPL